jgi:uncharacterized RDD family membrane protein YckC
MAEETKTSADLRDNGKRFEAFFLDAAIVAMLSMVVFALIGAPLFGYYSAAEEVEAAAAEVEAAAQATHLLSSLDEISPSDEGEAAMASSWVYAKAAGEDPAKGDVLYYYDCVYKGLPVASYNAKFAFEGSASQTAYSRLFAIEDPAEPIVFAEAYEPLIKGYAMGSDDSGPAAAAYADAIGSFKEIYRADWVEFGGSAAYSVPYVAYLAANEKIQYEAGGASLVSYALSALAVYVGLPFLFKNGKTLSKRILGLAVVSDRGALSKWQVASRGLIETASFCGLAVFAPFLFFQLPAIALPILAAGGFALSMWEVVLASLLVTALSGFLTLFTKEKKSLHDLATLTGVISESKASLRKREEERKEAEHGGSGEPAGDA